MKLQEREKNLLVLAGSVLCLVILWMYGISPLSAKVSDVKDKKDQLQSQLTLSQNQIASIPKLQKAIEKSVIDGRQITSGFIQDPSQKWIMKNILAPFTKECNLTIDAENYSTLRLVSKEMIMKDTIIDEEDTLTSVDSIIKKDYSNIEQKKKQEKVKVGDSAPINNVVGQYELRLKVIGQYSDFTKFIKKIENFNKKIIVSQVDIEKRKDGKVDFSVMLEFYQFYNFYEENPTDTFYQYNPNSSYNNRVDPFAGKQKPAAVKTKGKK